MTTADPGPTRFIDAFLADLPEDKRAALESLRRMIARAAPEAVESISYGIPAFRYKGRPLVSFAAATRHCSFFVMSPAVLDAFREESVSHDLSKGTIRFTPDAPMAEELVERIVRARIAEIDARVR